MDTNILRKRHRAAETAIPTSYIHSLIVQPENAGDKSRVLSWLLRKWGSEGVQVQNALAYRTPKKPESKNYHFGGMFLPACPTCGEFLEDESYCPKCGQAIDWGKYDGES